MLQWYPTQVRIGSAPAVTIFMVIIAIVGRAVMPGAPVFMWPLYATLPIVALLHLYLLIDDESMNKLDATFYALVHLPLAFVVWTFSIMFATGSDLF